MHIRRVCYFQSPLWLHETDFLAVGKSPSHQLPGVEQNRGFPYKAGLSGNNTRCGGKQHESYSDSENYLGRAVALRRQSHSAGRVCGALNHCPRILFRAVNGDPSGAPSVFRELLGSRA